MTYIFKPWIYDLQNSKINDEYHSVNCVDFNVYIAYILELWPNYDLIQ